MLTRPRCTQAGFGRQSRYACERAHSFSLWKCLVSDQASVDFLGRLDLRAGGFAPDGAGSRRLQAWCSFPGEFEARVLVVSSACWIFECTVLRLPLLSNRWWRCLALSTRTWACAFTFEQSEGRNSCGASPSRDVFHTLRKSRHSASGQRGPLRASRAAAHFAVPARSSLAGGGL